MIVEASTLQEWGDAMRVHFGIAVEDCQLNRRDPPDGYAVVNDQRLSIELVQLVTQNHLNRAINGESPNAGALFRDAQWSQKRLESALNKIIAKKTQAYTKRALKFDVLLIHCDEPWLLPSDVARWQAALQLDEQDVFGHIHLLLDYDPGFSQEAWPLFQLVGSQFDGK